jgi:hypothetical protein
MSAQLSLDAARAGRRARARGGRGEREIVDVLRAFGWKLARRNTVFPQFGRDILDGPAGTRISCKYTERLRLREAFAECAEHSQPGEIPVIFHRCNGQPWLATLPLDELLPLLALRERA